MAKEPAPKPAPKGKNPNPMPAAKPITANRASVCGPMGRETSVDVRRISNGFIIRETSYGGKGGYKSTERFADKAPTIQVAPTKGRK